MAEALFFPCDPHETPRVVEIHDPVEVLDYLHDPFTVARSREWSAYVLTEHRPDQSPNPLAAHLLDQGQAAGRTDWAQSLHGPVLVMPHPAVVAAPLSLELKAQTAQSKDALGEAVSALLADQPRLREILETLVVSGTRLGVTGPWSGEETERVAGEVCEHFGHLVPLRDAPSLLDGAGETLVPHEVTPSLRDIWGTLQPLGD